MEDRIFTVQALYSQLTESRSIFSSSVMDNAVLLRPRDNSAEPPLDERLLCKVGEPSGAGPTDGLLCGASAVLLRFLIL